MKAEQLIRDYTKHCSNVLCAVEDKYGKKVISYREWLTPDQALSAVEIEREEVIEKAVNFIAENLSKGTTERLQTKVKFIRDFKKYMEEQV